MKCEWYLINIILSFILKLFNINIYFILVSIANIIIKNEKPGSILRGTENERLSLECTFDGINTGETLIWLRNGDIVTDACHGYALYSFIPTKKDHLSEFCCEVYDTWKSKIKQKVITLDIKCTLITAFCLFLNVSSCFITV